MSSAPPGGFYVCAFRKMLPKHGMEVGTVPIYLAGPFKVWADAEQTVSKVMAIHFDATLWQTNHEGDKVGVAFFQAPELPIGMFNVRLWVDKTKLVS